MASMPSDWVKQMGTNRQRSIGDVSRVASEELHAAAIYFAEARRRLLRARPQLLEGH
jgi:hypothetical protein